MDPRPPEPTRRDALRALGAACLLPALRPRTAAAPAARRPPLVLRPEGALAGLGPIPLAAAGPPSLLQLDRPAYRQRRGSESLLDALHVGVTIALADLLGHAAARASLPSWGELLATAAAGDWACFAGAPRAEVTLEGLQFPDAAAWRAFESAYGHPFGVAYASSFRVEGPWGALRFERVWLTLTTRPDPSTPAPLISLRAIFGAVRWADGAPVVREP